MDACRESASASAELPRHHLSLFLKYTRHWTLDVSVCETTGVLASSSASASLCRSKCTKKIPSHTSHVQRLARYTRTPSFPLEEASCLGLDEAGSRKHITTVFTLFRGSFEVIFSFFQCSEGRWDYPESVIRPPIIFQLHPKTWRVLVRLEGGQPPF